MTPWYRGFKGTIEKIGDGKYTMSGIVKQIDDNTYDVTELPIGMWTQNYKETLEKWVAGTTEKEPPYVKVAFQIQILAVTSTYPLIGLQRISY